MMIDINVRAFMSISVSKGIFVNIQYIHNNFVSSNSKNKE